MRKRNTRGYIEHSFIICIESSRVIEHERFGSGSGSGSLEWGRTEVFICIYAWHELIMSRNIVI